ncbi:MAG: GNAT family protein [Candidatus Bathyarchaeia archaeon]|jgi:RimJ/RimL family protein N-acetyltransferase
MWKTKLKNGKEVTLRFRKTDDADNLFQMFSSMSEKSLEWSMAPYTKDVIERWMRDLPNMIPLVSEYQGKIVGQAVIHRFPHPCKKGVGELSVYLRDDFQNVGLGTALTKKILKLAKKEKMHKIELGVVAENKIAIHLYEKCGFQIEGTIKDSFHGRDGKYHDAVKMGLILS